MIKKNLKTLIITSIVMLLPILAGLILSFGAVTRTKFFTLMITMMFFLK